MNLRWTLTGMLFLTLLTGAFVTMGSLPTHQYTYVLGLLGISVLMGIVILRLRGLLVVDIPIWIVLFIIFSSYCVKLILIVNNPESPVLLGMLPRIGLNNPDMPALWINGLRLTLLGTISYCVAYCLISKLWPTTTEWAQSNNPLYAKSNLWWWLWGGLFLLSVGSAWLSYNYDIGLMGSEIKLALPYKLRGIIFYFRSYLLIGFLLLLAYAAYRQSSTPRFCFAIALIILNGVVDALIRSSKAALLAPFLYVFFLMVVAGMPLHKRYLVTFLLVCVPILLFLPYLNDLRVFRIAGVGIWDAINMTINSSNLSPFESLAHWVIWVIYRLPGVEMLIGISGHPIPSLNSNWLEIFRRPNGVAGFLTNDVFLTPRHHPHLAAPGYYGWWYLVLGKFGVCVGGGVLAIFSYLGWKVLFKANFHAVIVAKVFFLMILFIAVSEGTLDLLFKPFAAILITLVFIQVIMSMFENFSYKFIASAK